MSTEEIVIDSTEGVRNQLLKDIQEAHNNDDIYNAICNYKLFIEALSILWQICHPLKDD